MGSKYMTVEQAASFLGVSNRSIYRYATRGLLETKVDGRHTLVPEDQVRQIRKGRHDMLSSPIKRDVVSMLMMEVQTLKMQMATVMKILNVRYEPLKCTIPEYLRLYQTAEQMANDGWSPHEEELWAEYFVRITVEDLEGIEFATEQKHPWIPFLKLATTMHLRHYNAHLTDILAAGRTNMQRVAGMWCVLREESPRVFDILQERDAAPLKKLLRRMQKA